MQGVADPQCSVDGAPVPSLPPVPDACSCAGDTRPSIGCWQPGCWQQSPGHWESLPSWHWAQDARGWSLGRDGPVGWPRQGRLQSGSHAWAHWGGCPWAESRCVSPAADGTQRQQPRPEPRSLSPPWPPAPPCTQEKKEGGSRAASEELCECVLAGRGGTRGQCWESKRGSKVEGTAGCMAGYDRAGEGAVRVEEEGGGGQTPSTLTCCD